MDLLGKFEQALGFAAIYDGAEQRYGDFFKAAIAYEQAGGTQESVNVLLEAAKQAFARTFNANSAESFWARLERAGAKVFDCGAVLIPPDTDAGGIKPATSDSPTPYTRPHYQARLAEVVRALEAQGVYVDDMVFDIGRVYPGQIRTQPYVIVTIPRLNAQIAVSDQENEALFVAQPSMPVGDWALFRKAGLKTEPAKWPDITRIVHAGAWQDKLLKVVFGTLDSVGPKVQLDGFVKAHRSKEYELSDRMIIALAVAVRNADPTYRRPTVKDRKPIARDLLVQVTGDPDFPDISFTVIDDRLRAKGRSLAQLLDTEPSFDTDLTEAQIIQLAIAVRNADKSYRRPTVNNTQPIARGILEQVTGNPYFPDISFNLFDQRLRKKGRSLAQLLDTEPSLHTDLTDAQIIQLAIAVRNADPTYRRPTLEDIQPIARDIVEHVTGNPYFPDISFRAIDGRLRLKGSSLSKLLDEAGVPKTLGPKPPQP